MFAGKTLVLNTLNNYVSSTLKGILYAVSVLASLDVLNFS